MLFFQYTKSFLSLSQVNEFLLSSDVPLSFVEGGLLIELSLFLYYDVVVMEHKRNVSCFSKILIFS